MADNLFLSKYSNNAINGIISSINFKHSILYQQLFEKMLTYANMYSITDNSMHVL